MDKFYLTYDEFETSARDFVAISSKLKDGWRERTIKVASRPEKETVYLVKTVSFLLNNDSSQGEGTEKDHQSIEEHTEDDWCIEEEDDPAIMSSSGITQATNSQHVSTEADPLQVSKLTQKTPHLSVHMEYHIVHSFSYEVPVLYFNATYSNGRRLSLEDTWKLVSKRFVSSDVDRWGMISQQEHPLLHCPFYHIHPCHTAKVMAQAASKKASSPGPLSEEGERDEATDKMGEEEEGSGQGLATVVTSSGEAEKEGGGDLTTGEGDMPHQAAAASEPDYLVTWLSTFGPLVGLTLPVQYGLS